MIGRNEKVKRENREMTTDTKNPLGLDGIDFVEFASPDPEALHRLFLELGCSRLMRNEAKNVDLYAQNDIVFLLDRNPSSWAAGFARAHGPTICAMGWRVNDAAAALGEAVRRGARAIPAGDLSVGDAPLPGIFGIGESILYLVDGPRDLGRFEKMGFTELAAPDLVPAKGFALIDHLTNNVQKGTMQKTASFYKDVFGFTEVRYFDIRGVATGLQSYALRSPCGKFCIPINEATEAASQINEYLREHRGPGVQHLALLTSDLLASLKGLDGTSLRFLDIDAEYYQTVFDRVPHVSEDRKEIEQRHVLVDGDAEGYLLQIFTQNLCGPIFLELIQRKNHLSFGEGNFTALFRSIERDQARRGVL